MRYPFDKYRTGTRYGQKGSLWKCGWHSGQDFLSANYGGDGIIYPIMHGVVEKVAHSASYGNYVMVRHPEGYVSLYAHMKTVYIKKGTVVTERTALGVEGATGNATGRHLHLEVHKGSYHYPADIDPLAFIKERLEVRYNKIEDMPLWARPAIRKLWDKGYLNGSGTVKDGNGRPADLDLSLDMIRLFVINDNAGLYK